MDTWHKRLTYAREKRGIKKSAFAKLVGVSAPTVTDWESGDIKMLDGVKLVSVCKVLDIQAKWLLDNIGEMDASTNVDDAPSLRPFRDVPVVGTVQAGKDGFFDSLYMPVGHGDGAITYPAKDKYSYAVRVKGDSMRPRIKAGEFIVVEPSHEPQPGDDVVVVLKDGQRMVKELLYQRDGEITLGSINNGHGNITVSLEDVDKIHYVAAIIPRGAFYKP